MKLIRKLLRALEELGRRPVCPRCGSHYSGGWYGPPECDCRWNEYVKKLNSTTKDTTS